MLVLSIFIQDFKDNITIENTIPIAYLPYLKVSKHIPLIDKNTQKFIEQLLPSINETALGLTIEVEDKKTYVKVEVMYEVIYSV